MGCAGDPLSHVLYQERSFFVTSFHSKKERKEIKLVLPNNGKDLVFLMTGRTFVGGEGEACCLGLRGFGLLEATPVLQWSSRYSPRTFSALNSSRGGTYPASSHQPERGKM